MTRKAIKHCDFRWHSQRFRRSSTPPTQARLQRVAYRLIHLLDPLIRLESLYRYLSKFHSLAERRYVLFVPTTSPQRSWCCCRWSSCQARACCSVR